MDRKGFNLLFEAKRKTFSKDEMRDWLITRQMENPELRIHDDEVDRLLEQYYPAYFEVRKKIEEKLQKQVEETKAIKKARVNWEKTSRLNRYVFLRLNNSQFDYLKSKENYNSFIRMLINEYKEKEEKVKPVETN